MLTTKEAHSVRLAQRMSDLGTETAFMVLERARELERKGRTVIHLEIGEPDFATPSHIVEAAIQALRDGATHYGPSAGLPEAREAVAKYVSDTRGVTVGPDRVVITPGAKPIMYFTILALADEGDEVIYPNPGFPIYESVIRFVGARPVPVRLREENGFQLDIDELLDLVTERTKLIIINSPQNPTGSILTRAQLEVLGRLAVERDIYILADEIYSRIVYEGEFVSILHAVPEALDQVILLDGMSKTFAMTGWRLGWGVMPPKLASAVAKLQTNSTSCTATFSQKVIGPALFGPQEPVENMRREFQRRRDAIVDGLNRIEPLVCRKPQGAFYVFPNISKLGLSAQAMADRLLQESGVAALAGTAFGKYGEGYLRFSYANSIENINIGLERIADFVSKL